jgi:type II secretory pathway pseudopilin PulG
MLIDLQVRSSAFTRQGEPPPEGGTPNGGVSLPTTLNTQPSTLNQLRAFTLIEVLVVVVLMSFIILALMAVFNGTQTAFRASITQTDVLEGGRDAMGMIKSDLEAMTPSFLSTPNYVAGTYIVPNFYAQATNSFTQPLTGSSASRANVMEDVFFITRQNQTWKGVGYFVRSNILSSGVVGTPGILYRFETNYSAAQFAQLAQTQYGPFVAYDLARQGYYPTNIGVSRILDGVMAFKVRAYDTNGIWMITNVVLKSGVTNVQADRTNSWTAVTGDPAFIYMYSNALPASVEIELGVLEDRALQRVESLNGSLQAQNNYLAQQAGKVHVFRQRAWIRNVDPSAFQ